MVLMRYSITRLVLGCQQSVDLTPEKYAEAKKAKEQLLVALSIEEKLNLVLENYAEFEEELQGLTLRQLIFSDGDWSSFIGELQTVNRRLANLLSACRLYIDQIKHEISALYGFDSAQYQALGQAFSAEYDGYLGYRVLEALRNHVQHRSLPVHNLTYNGSREEKPNRMLCRHACTPSLSIARIKEEGNFKAQVLAELEGDDDLVDLKPLVREYVTSIGRVHQGLRQRMHSDVEAWEEVIHSIRARFCETHGDKTAGLAVIAIDADQRVRESTQVFEEMITRRRRLEQKNRNVGQLRSHYVSSAVVGDDA
ncbi:MAG: hypothetical protein WBF17_17210 [Phycisphaerae bacterium]